MEEMNNTEKIKRIKRFIADLQKEKMVDKYLYPYTWLSGSSTNVRPITVWHRYIELQWNSRKRMFDKFIDKTVRDNSDLLSDGSFCKGDGSCPATIIFYFNKEYWGD